MIKKHLWINAEPIMQTKIKIRTLTDVALNKTISINLNTQAFLHSDYIEMQQSQLGITISCSAARP